VCMCSGSVIHTSGQFSQTVKVSDFKFHMHVPRDSLQSGIRTWPLKTCLKRGRGQGHMTPDFCALNANISKKRIKLQT